jgi:hypothetical protein
MPFAFGDDRLRIVGMAHQHQHGDVVCAAIGDPGKVGQQLRVVARVGFRLAAIAGGEDARCAAQRRDAQAGVVGQRRQPGQAGGVAGLGDGVLDERDVRFLRFRHVEGGLRQHVEIEGRQQLAEFAQLAGVARSENQFLHNASEALCAFTMSRMPAAASSSSVSSSARENGSPSAVPCTSMMPPPAVITTFMSVSQPESSA